MSDFDQAAVVYDQTFTFSCVGKTQRDQVWQYVSQLQIQSGHKVLEINCGTGEDAARWLKAGYRITATDLSSGMIAVSKNNHPEIDFQVLNMLDIDTLKESYDILFSNFGGVNCLSATELHSLFRKAAVSETIRERMILVVMGKKCLWDRFYQLFKGRFRSIFRRNTKQPVIVHVDGTDVNTWYYSPKEIRQMAAPYFTVETIRPIGLFVPPSYLAPFFEKRPRLFSFLKRADQFLSFGFMADYADHFFISLVRKEHIK